MEAEFPVKDFNIKYIIGTDLQESDVVFENEKATISLSSKLKGIPFVNAIYLCNLYHRFNR